MAFRPAPLNTGFMIAGILGFLVSVVYVYPNMSPKWGFAFAVVFFAMVISSFISMSLAPAEGQLMPKLEKATAEPEGMYLPNPPRRIRVVRVGKKKKSGKAKRKKHRK